CYQTIARTDNGIGDFRVEHAEVAVRQRAGLLHIAESRNEVRLLRHRNAGDMEVLFTAQRLHAVVCGVGYLFLSQEVSFSPSSHVIAPPGHRGLPIDQRRLHLLSVRSFSFTAWFLPGAPRGPRYRQLAGLKTDQFRRRSPWTSADLDQLLPIMHG